LVFCLQRPVIATIASVCVFFVACSSSPNPPAAAATSVKPPKERKEAPDFSLKDAYGKTVRLSDYRSKVVLLNFWATWCGPCKIEIPWFNEFEQQNKDRGFAVLGISMDEEGWEVVKPFTARLKVNYRVLMGDDLTAELYGGVGSLPTSFLIDRHGKVASVHVGLVSKSDYENEIEEILAAPARSARGADVAGVPAAAVGAR
jgi:peroxiredoxin